MDIKAMKNKLHTSLFGRCTLRSCFAMRPRRSSCGPRGGVVSCRLRVFDGTREHWLNRHRGFSWVSIPTFSQRDHQMSVIDKLVRRFAQQGMRALCIRHDRMMPPTRDGTPALELLISASLHLRRR